MTRGCRPTVRPGLTGARVVSGLSALLALAGCRLGEPPGAGMQALRGATVIDVVDGRRLSGAVILVRNGAIVTIGGPELPVPDGAVTVDLQGRWIIPGLIDAHTHLQPWGLATALRYGVTTVRDLHDGFPLAAQLRRTAADHPAPRLYQAITMVDGDPATYPDALPIRDAAGATAAVHRLADSGARWIKTYSRTTPVLLEAVVAAARARRLPVTAHLGLVDARTAARLGVSAIEHLTGIPEALGDSVALMRAHRSGFFAGWTAFESRWEFLDSTAIDAFAAELAATGVTLVPTLGLHDIFARLDDPDVLRHPDLQAVPDSARANWNVPGMVARAGWGRDDFPAFRAGRAVQDRFVHRFVRAGGRVATGTDASNQLLVPGAAVHLEMELLVRAGLTPLEALRAATLHGADLLRADSLGRLRAGAAADLVVLGRDPLIDIRGTRAIERVMIRGVWVDR